LPVVGRRSFFATDRRKRRARRRPTLAMRITGTRNARNAEEKVIKIILVEGIEVEWRWFEGGKLGHDMI